MLDRLQLRLWPPLGRHCEGQPRDGETGHYRILHGYSSTLSANSIERDAERADLRPRRTGARLPYSLVLPANGIAHSVSVFDLHAKRVLSDIRLVQINEMPLSEPSRGQANLQLSYRIPYS